MSIQAIILAAGKGSRLHPLTLDRSKAMMPIAGKTMITRVMELLRVAGLQEFIIVAHPEDQELQRSFTGDSTIRFAWQAERKGMAHALMCAAPFIHGDFVLSACDNLVDPLEATAFIQAFRDHPDPRPSGYLSLIRVSKEKMKSMGMVIWDGEKIEKIVEKPSEEAVISNLASIPLYCFSESFLDFVAQVQPSKRGEYELQDAVQMLINKRHAVHGMMFSGRRTVTNANDLLALNIELLAQENLITPIRTSPGFEWIEPCLMEPGVVVEAGCRVGPNVFIETGSRIGHGALLQNALVLRGSIVPAGTIVENQIFSG